MKNRILLFALLTPLLIFAQSEKYPEYNICQNVEVKNIEQCFYETTKELFFNEFKVPSIIENEKYKGNINAVFLVTNTGQFKLLYINSP